MTLKECMIGTMVGVFAGLIVIGLQIAMAFEGGWFIAVLISIFAAGFWTGWWSKRWFVSKISLQNFMAQMDVQLKALLMAVADKRAIYTTASGWRNFSQAYKPYFERFLTWSYVDGGKAIVKPKKALLKFRAKHSDFFEQAIETMEAHGAEKGEVIAAPPTNDKSYTVWWWSKQ